MHTTIRFIGTRSASQLHILKKGIEIHRNQVPTSTEPVHAIRVRLRLSWAVQVSCKICSPQPPPYRSLLAQRTMSEGLERACQIDSESESAWGPALSLVPAVAADLAGPILDADSSVSADLVFVTLSAPHSRQRPPAHPRRATRAGRSLGGPVRVRVTARRVMHRAFGFFQKVPERTSVHPARLSGPGP